MKAQKILTISIVALVCLFLLQGLWLYNTYQLKLEEIHNEINSALLNAVSQEMDQRTLLINDHHDFIDTALVFQIQNQLDINSLQDVNSQQKEFMQAFLVDACQSPLNITNLDSIFVSCMSERKLNLAYQLHFRNTDFIYESAGSNVSFGYVSDPVPIVDNKYVEAIVHIPMPLIFQRMFTILIVSLIFLILLVVILIYEMRFIFTQQRLNQLRDDFTHALTHDMKTPLGTIYMVLDQWGKGVLDNQSEMRTQFCKVANDQVLNLQALVDRILTSAYIEERKLHLNIQPVDIREILDGLVDKFTIKGGKPIEFHTHFEIADVSVFADPLYLTNAISNLIDNAIKYSGESVTIHLSCVANDQMVQIKVKDNGWGISMKDQSKVFNRYERGVAVKQRKVSGFGLGLSYVKKVVEAHGGTAAVSSMPNEGSEFVIAIPVEVKK